MNAGGSVNTVTFILREHPGTMILRKEQGVVYVIMFRQEIIIGVLPEKIMHPVSVPGEHPRRLDRTREDTVPEKCMEARDCIRIFPCNYYLPR